MTARLTGHGPWFPGPAGRRHAGFTVEGLDGKTSATRSPIAGTAP